MEFLKHLFDDLAIKLCLVAIYALLAVSLFMFARGHAEAHKRGWESMLSIWAVALILLCFLGLALLAIQTGVAVSVVWLAAGIAVGFIWLIKASCDEPDGEFHDQIV